MLEKLKYIKDMHEKQKELRIDKLAFYNMPELDINEDGMPDQWTVNNADEVSIGSSDGNMIIENSNANAWNFIHSRTLELENGKTYRIEVEFENIPVLSTIPYNLVGISEKNGELKPGQDSAIYTSEIAVPGDKKLGNNALRIYVKGRYEIKRLNVMEK